MTDRVKNGPAIYGSLYLENRDLRFLEEKLAKRARGETLTPKEVRELIDREPLLDRGHWQVVDLALKKLGVPGTEKKHHNTADIFHRYVAGALADERGVTNELFRLDREIFKRRKPSPVLKQQHWDLQDLRSKYARGPDTTRKPEDIDRLDALVQKRTAPGGKLTPAERLEVAQRFPMPSVPALARREMTRKLLAAKGEKLGALAPAKQEDTLALLVGSQEEVQVQLQHCLEQIQLLQARLRNPGTQDVSALQNQLAAQQSQSEILQHLAAAIARIPNYRAGQDISLVVSAGLGGQALLVGAQFFGKLFVSPADLVSGKHHVSAGAQVGANALLWGKGHVWAEQGGPTQLLGLAQLSRTVEPMTGTNIRLGIPVIGGFTFSDRNYVGMDASLPMVAFPSPIPLNLPGSSSAYAFGIVLNAELRFSEPRAEPVTRFLRKSHAWLVKKVADPLRRIFLEPEIGRPEGLPSSIDDRLDRAKAEALGGMRGTLVQRI